MEKIVEWISVSVGNNEVFSVYKNITMGGQTICCFRRSPLRIQNEMNKAIPDETEGSTKKERLDTMLSWPSVRIWGHYGACGWFYCDRWSTDYATQKCHSRYAMLVCLLLCFFIIRIFALSLFLCVYILLSSCLYLHPLVSLWVAVFSCYVPVMRLSCVFVCGFT